MNASQNKILTKKIYLASGSPRRAELLLQVGVDFEVISVNVDENTQKQENVEAYVARLALEKAKEGHKCVLNKKIPVLGADTAVYIDGKILGKPTNFDDARRMLKLLSGKTHQVLTAVAVVDADKQEQIVKTTDVTMREITEEEIAAYWQTGEPKDKAGGYAIQGKAAIFISGIEGSYSGVMGLPVFETVNLLSKYQNRGFCLK